jgi:hypothetical protein
MRFHEILDEKYSLERRTLHFGPIFGEPRKLYSYFLGPQFPFMICYVNLKKGGQKGCIPSGFFQKKNPKQEKNVRETFYEKWEKYS